MLFAHFGSMFAQFAVAVGTHFKGPYTVVRKLDLFGEDAGLWRDARGNFHMIFHGGKSVFFSLSTNFCASYNQYFVQVTINICVCLLVCVFVS